jgi:hypothetical protein
LNGTYRREEPAKRFFFEKKNQKTFVPVYTPSDRTATATKKSFASFLQKRRLFFLERKKQRTFIIMAVAAGTTGAHTISSSFIALSGGA